MAKAKKKAEKPTIIVRDVPPGLREKFKAHCALKGTDMKHELVKFMERCVNENGKAKK